MGAAMKTALALALLALTSPALAQEDPYAYGAPYHEPYEDQQVNNYNSDYGNPEPEMGTPGVSPTPWENGGQMRGSCIGYVCD